MHNVYEFTVNPAEMNGTSNIFNINGTFHLTIDSVNVASYTVIIEQDIDSIPKFHSWIILPLFLVVSFVAILAKKRLLQNTS